ncbi:MAG: hypothetical protein L3J82_08340, partial [Planctomycetes bacterium]|nr:hypothetical protein [Planctomycetota bacterium]
RLDEYTWYQQGATNTDGDMHVRNHQNAIIRHAQAFAGALSSAGGGYFFDGASNEAIADGDVLLAGYALTDWLLGNESTLDETFSDSEQTLLTAYLSGGGKLFTSGAEIAWDLDDQGSSSDQIFINSTLGAAYVADDSGDYTVDAIAGGPFAGLAQITFDDGTGDSYSVNYPDVLATSNGSTAVLEYSTGIVAATQSAGAIVLGFPFETINGATARTGFMQAVSRDLIPSYNGTNGSGFGSGAGESGSTGDDGGCALSTASALPFGLILLAMLILNRRQRHRIFAR